jgi:hypothetical protein
MLRAGQEVLMPYYLLTIRRPGSVHYKEALDSKHHLNAPDLRHALADADALLDNHYDRKTAKAVIQLYDETGLVATRIGEGPWDA